MLIAEKYQLVRLVGRGGMGAVYEARNLTTLKRCAVKLLLSPELAGDAEVVRRFFREAKASGLIESEHVVAAFDSGIDAAGRVYYVMECLQGEDLEQALDRHGRIKPQAAVKLAMQAARGLASAHQHGIVHRDVKPANLFLASGPGGEVKVKILDFGVAKVKMEVFNESNSSLTMSGSLLGTPLYMSPDQLRRASAIDPSADVWSLGVVLFECLTGELPWGECDGIGELVTAILTQPVPPIQDLAPWVRPELAEIVQRALSRDAERRLKSAAEMVEALSKLVVGDPRLHQHEIAPPDEAERSSYAPRLAVADTVMGVATPQSGVPVVTTTPPTRSRSQAVLRPVLFGVAALAGAAVWSLGAKSSGRAVLPAASGHSAAPSATTTTVDVTTPPSAVPPSVKIFSLDVRPKNAQVTVDGVPAAVRDGRVSVEGAVGSVHSVQLTVAGRKTSSPVAITKEGLVPSQVTAAVGGPPAGNGKLPKTAPDPTNSETSSGVKPPDSMGLSSKFE